MSASINLGNGATIHLDAVDMVGEPNLQAPDGRFRGVLLTIEAHGLGRVVDCTMIPRDKVQLLAESLGLVAAQLP